MTLTTPALDRSSSWWFGARPCPPAPRGPPSSLMQQGSGQLANRPPFRAVVAHSHRHTVRTGVPFAPTPCPDRPARYCSGVGTGVRPGGYPPSGVTSARPPSSRLSNSCRPNEAPVCPSLAVSHEPSIRRGSPRVRRVTFAPHTRRIYVRSVRSAFGLQVFSPPRPPRVRLLCGSCSSGRSLAPTFLPASPRGATVAVQLGVPGTRGPQGTCTPKSLPGSLPLTGCQRQSRRCAPCLAH
jgi:hypothetical protein